MKTKLSLLYLLSFIFCLLSLSEPSALSQIPQGFNYQAIARDGSGNPILNTLLPVRITIQADSSGTIILWQEVHTSVTSNSYGLINLVIGRGARQAASTITSFSDINWTVTPKFIKTEIYFGSDYLTMGVSRLWSVPYAMYSLSSNPWQLNGSSLYYAGGFVGIETSTPVTPLTVTYNDNTGITYPLYIQNASGDWTATEKGVGLKFGRIDPTSGHDYGTIRGTIASASGGDGRLQFIGGGGSDPHMTINHLGNVGIGTTAPADKLHINGNTIVEGMIAGRYSTGYGNVLQVGNDARIADINMANTIGINGISDETQGHIKLGSSGPTISGVSGNVGIGTTTPGNKLEVNGGITSSGLTIASGVQTGLQIYKSDNATDQKSTELLSLGANGSFVGRFVNDAYTQAEAWFNVARNTGTFTVNSVTFPSGKVGIGTVTSSSKLAIQPDASWSDEVPLFEVKNKLGVPVLAVYNNGVRILVDHTIGKGIKSGFAVGGYDMTKAGKTVDLMIISPDSIRFNINNDESKAVKSGFAVGGYDATKGTINQDFMYLTPQNSVNGKYNTFLGYKSGTNTGGSMLYSNYNTFIGYQAGFSNVYGYSNVFIGYNAGYSNYGSSFGTTGYNNVYIGQLTGEKNLGANNVLIGDESGKALINGSKNVIIGSAAGLQTTGNYNTYIGAGAGRSDTGSDNVMIGYNASLGSGESDVFVIGNRHNTGLISGSFSNDLLYLWANVGVGTSAIGTYRLYVNGNAWATGTWGSSDARWKKNIADLDGALDKIVKLNPVTFEWRKEEFPEINFDSGIQLGLVAQDVEDIYPELVKTNSDGYKAIAYDKLNAVLIKGMQEQQLQIESQQKQIDELKAIINEMREKIASSPGSSQ